MSDYQHPIAYPVILLVVGLMMVFGRIDDVLAGDGFARLGFASGIVLLALVAFDFFKRWRRRKD